VKKVFLFVTLSFGGAINVKAIDLYQDTKPQSTGRTCQSFSAALALASKGDISFPINSFDELRETEQRFRLLAESYGDPLNHQTWSNAMSDLTNGKYTFELSYKHSDYVNWLTEIKSLTSIDTEIDLMVSKLSGSSFDVVLTSVNELAGSSYGSGHIISVLGVVGSGINSNTQLVAFNSAIKGENASGVMCTPDTLPGDERYSAGVVSSNDFQLKGYPNNFLIMRLVENEG